MEQWIEYVIANYGSMEEFNKLPYKVRHSVWEDFVSESEEE